MPLWTLEPEDPIFAASFHPDKAQFVVGFATGNVTAFSYTYEDQPKELWSTKRHKSSCRVIGYTQDGDYVFSAGTDRVIKKADSQTGKVVAKCALDSDPSAMAINSEFVFVGDDDGNVCVFDFKLKRTHKFDSVVEDCVDTICCLEYKNQYHILVTGVTSVVHIDIRNGVKSTSEDQEDEILCGCVPNEQKSVFGMSEGVITIWNNNHLLDQQSRVRLAKEGSVDAILAGETEDTVFAGTSDGVVFEVNIRAGKVESKRTHSAKGEDEVSILDWDYDYHLVSGSLEKIILWDKGETDPVQVQQEPKQESTKRKKGKKSKKGDQPAKKVKMFEDL